MSEELLQTAAMEAAAYGIPVFSHPTDIKGAEAAVENGVSILVHVAPDDRQPWSDEFIQKMVHNGVAITPTLQLYKWDLQRFEIPWENNPLIETALGQLSAFYKAGGRILFGTDVGYMTQYNPAEEYQLMEMAGLCFEDILASLTVHPAAEFGFASTKGKIASDYDADLILLEEDPREDIKHLSQVYLSIHKGRVIFSADQ